MTAFNIVRIRVKPGYDDQFIEEHQNMDIDRPGMRRATLVKTGDSSYCFIGEWDDMENIVSAREEMVARLDRFRHMLEDLGGELGVTDPVSGGMVVDIRK
jgi:hypothetical protein